MNASACQFRRCLLLCSLAAGALALPRGAHAHGIWGHIHVTGWAVENLPPGELRDFFDDPQVLNAALYGAAYCDSGYWPRDAEIAGPAREYGEHNHWEPFVETYIQWLIANDPPPWDDLESRKRVAFLLGVASHGLQDELFDSLFLYQVEQNDSGSQDNADPGTDGFLAQDGWIRMIPEPYYPLETLLEIYEPLGPEITEAVIANGNNLMTQLYVNDGLGPIIAESNGELYRPELPWTAAHYLDPDIPGSLRSEIVPTGLYMQAVWERIHQSWDESNLVIHTYPELPRRLRSGDSEDVSSWITVVFGRGVRVNSIDFELQDQEGSAVPFERRSTRWGGESDWSRLARVLPQQDLGPGEAYTLSMDAGVVMIGRDPLSMPWSFSFTVDCEGSSEACPPVEGAFVPDIGEPNPPEVVDVPDAGTPDAGEPDVGIPDAEAPDVDESDAGTEPDTESTTDGETDDNDGENERPDTIPDEDVSDVVSTDTEGQAGAEGAATAGSSGGCSSNGGQGSGAPAMLMAMGALLVFRPRNRRP